MKKIILMLFVVVIHNSLLAQTPTPGVVLSDKDGWHKVGETKADFKTETDKIMVIGANRFSSLKIKVSEAPINLVSFTINYGKGEKKEVKIGQEFKTPGETKKVDLGGKKNVASVEFIYKTIGDHTDKKAHIELWGYKTNP